MKTRKPWIRPGHPDPNETPRLGRRLWNVSQAMLDFLADGCRTLDATSYRERLETCDVCERRNGDQCLVCGCRLSLKARGRAFRCPLGKWKVAGPAPKTKTRRAPP